jgi:hypothetical protein
MAHYRPDAAILLVAVAEVLDDVLGEVPPERQHQVRVAAHLARLVGRESRLGADATADEIAALGALLGEPIERAAAGNAALADRLRADAGPEFEAAAWSVLADITRRDLDVDKPGHTDWTGT